MSDITTILSTIQGAVDRLSASVAIKQEPLYKQLVGMLKNLDTKGDQLVNNINNLKKINQIKLNLEKLIMDAKYKSEVTSFAKSYDDVANLHNDYFSQFAGAHGATKALKVLKNTAIESTVNGLMANGLQVGVTDGIRKMLQNNISTGGSYAELTEQARKYMIGDGKNEGALERYVKTYSNTAINQYSAEYNKTIADDLGLEWYMYDGSLLETSREFCIKCVKKKYIHVSEFQTILDGNFGSLGNIPLSKSTGLPNGLMAGTDPSNFPRRRGGWNCGHQLIAVDDVVVPQNVKDAVYASAAYKQWAVGKGKKAEKPAEQSIEEKKAVKPEEKPVEVAAAAPVKPTPEKETKTAEIMADNKEQIQKIQKDKIKIYEDLLDSLPNTLTITKGNTTESHYNPVDNEIVIGNYNKAGKYGARNDSPYFRDTVMAHETGHAIHTQKDVIKTMTGEVSEAFETHFAELKQLIKGKESAIDKQLKDVYFNKATTSNEKEQLMVLFDILGSLTNGLYGGGHSVDYYKSKSKPEAEIFAHAVSLLKVDNAFAGLNQDMKAVVDAMKKKILDWL